MPQRSLRHLRQIALMAALLPTLFTTAAADWRYVTPDTTTGANPTRFLVATDGAIWTFENGAVSRNADGRTATLTRAMSGTTDGDAAFDDGYALDGGDVILRSSSCRLARVDPHLRLKWRIDLTGCSAVAANTTGAFWVARSGALMLFGADGVERKSITLGRSVLGIEAQADGGAVVVSQNANPPFSVIARYGSDGRELWNYNIGAAATSPRAVGAADGGVYVASLQGTSLVLSRLTAQGAPAWTTTHAVGSDSGIAEIQRAGDALYVVTGTGTGSPQPRALTRVGGDGRLQWQQTLCEVPGAMAGGIAGGLVVDANGSTAHVCALRGSDWFVRRDATGAMTAMPLFSIETSLQLARVGTVHYLLGHGPTVGNPTQLLAIDAANHIAPAVDGVPAATTPTRLRAHAVDSAGASYLLSKPDGIHAATLTKLDAQGRVVWERQAITFELYDATLRVLGSLLCSTELAAMQSVPNGNNLLRARCWDTRDGSGSSELQAFLPFTRAMAHAPLASGQSLLVVARAAEYTLQIRDLGGAMQQIGAGTGEVSQITIAEDGSSVLGVDDQLFRHAPDGTRAYRVPSPLAEYRSEFAIAADGSVVVLGRRGALPPDRLSVWSVAADGSTRWIVNLDAGFDRGRLVRGTDAVYLLQYASPRADTVQTTSRIVKLSNADGARLWQQESRNPTLDAAANDGGQIALVPLGSGSSPLLIAHAWANKLRVERLDPNTGERRDEQFLDCNGTCAQPHALVADGLGGARLAATVIDRQSGTSAAAFSTNALTTVTPPIASDQPGVAGLWFSPYANGEGMSIDWLPTSRTLFGAWFTYTTSGGNDPAQQRWYTLQINGVPAGATTLELPILETTGGNFDAGPAVAPHAVGRATLTFRDCSNATLNYRFDAGYNNAREGSVTLSRLTPQTRDCRLANGTIEPGAGARPAAKGFDARQSGAWYDESAVGQGLQLNIQPDGVFFAPWFTYDPAGTQNDPGRQHWLTLQGNLAQTVNGSVDVQLIQTIGGSFDNVPTYNAYVVGSATLRMQGCDRAVLDYRFADGTIAGPYAGRSGTLDLRRMGDCTP
ncbi:MAG: hypothetical protein AMXMBFR59_06370 [Rhodanobacteraceae bacterium]